MRIHNPPVRWLQLSAQPSYLPPSAVSLLFPHSQPTPLLNTPPLRATRDMAVQSGSARFQALFESALRDYEKKTGVTLAEHSLTQELQSCDSVDAITTLLQHQAQNFDDYRENDKILKLIRTTVSILTPLSSAASLADAVGVVRQKTLLPCIKSLTGFLTDIHAARESNTSWPGDPT